MGHIALCIRKRSLNLGDLHGSAVLTPGLGSGHDLSISEMEPRVRSVLNMESA